MMGLGNQMFQYAAGRALSLHSNVPLKVYTHSYTGYGLRIYELEKYFNIQPALATEADMASFSLAHPVRRIWNRLLPYHKLRALPYEENYFARWAYACFYLFQPPHTRPVYEERHFHFDKNFFKAKPPVFLKGYWMSDKYFSAYKDIIKNDFTIRPEWIQQQQSLAEEIQGWESVGIHVRGTDRKDARNLQLYGEISPCYFENAVRYIQEHRKRNVRLYVFSDDIEKAEKYIPQGFQSTFVSGRLTKDPIEDFYLMTQCKNLVMSNSTFSWWAAFLNHHTMPIIIAPARWYNKANYNYSDIYVNGWIKMNN